MSIKISMDSACDLTPELVKEYKIGIVPMTIVCGGKTYHDGIDFTPDDLFKEVESGGSCTTAAINEAEYAEVFDKYLEEDDFVIHFNLSSEISSCYQNACLAAQSRPVFVVDTRNLSSGAGMLALEGAYMARDGGEAEKIAEHLRALAKTVETSFVIDTLKYLHRGGRCSSVAALGANILKLKPCIEMENGKMDVGKKYRGNFDTVILQYVRDKLSNRNDIDTRVIYMTHTNGVSEETLKKVREEIMRCGDFKQVIAPIAGCTISNHSGPGTLGLLYYKKQQ